MSENKQTLPPSLTLHALSTDDARIIDVLLGKSSIRPFRNGDGIGHVVVIEMRDGERWELPLGDIGRIALARRGGNASAAVFGMVDPKDLNPNDARAAWSQFALIEGPTTEPNPSIMDGGGFMFVPFFAEENDGRKLRDRLHVVLESPFRPMDGLRPTLDLPRAFVKETSLAKVAQELHKSCTRAPAMSSRTSAVSTAICATNDSCRSDPSTPGILTPTGQNCLKVPG